MKASLRPLVVLILVISSISSFGQTEYYTPLDLALKNTNKTSIEFFAEDEQIPEFISRSSEFKSLKKIRIKRPANTIQSKLVLATISTFSDLAVLDLELSSFDTIPPYLDQFEGLQLMRISHAQSIVKVVEPVRFILKNGKEKAILEIISDQETAMDFMNRFFEKYPQMVASADDFELYSYRNDLTRIPKTYQSFQPMWLPQTSSAKINPSLASKIVTREGSVISIPASAFVNANGSTVTDSVQVDFTYIRDQLDMAFAGIGMETKVDNEDYLLESAGMFEINASSNGAFLSLATGKSIDIQMVSGTSGAFNVYDFDDANNTWQLQAEDNIPSKPGTEFTPAFFEYNRLYMKGNFTRAPEKLYPTGSQYFDSPDYMRFSHRENTFWSEVNREDESDVKHTLNTYKKSAKLRRSNLSYLLLVRERAPEKLLRSHQFFTLSELNDAFPEIKPIKKTVWYTEEPMNYSAFRSKYGKNSAYSDFRLSYDEAKEVFQFIFKDASGSFDTLNAIPYPPTQKAKDSKAQFHNEVLTAYEKTFRSLSQKVGRSAAATERKYSKAYSAQIERQKKRELKAWEKVKTEMTMVEKEMTFDEWYAYFTKMQRLYNQSIFPQNGTPDLVRSLNINNLGYWNCDNPMFKKSRFEPLQVLASKGDKVYRVSALFLSFNSTFSSDSKSKIDTKGNCAYILFGEGGISWITPREADLLSERKIRSERPFVPVEEIDIELLRQELLAFN